MRHIARFVHIQVGLSDEPGFAAAGLPRHLDGYIMNRSATAPQGRIRSWRFRVVEISVSGQASSGRNAGSHRPNGTHPRVLQLHPIGRLESLPVPSNPRLDNRVIPYAGKDESNTTQPQPANILRPIQSGESYRITSPPARGLVRTELAEALETVFERFARQQGFSGKQPLEISLSRGFKSNSHGHKEGRAADIDAVEGKSLLQWKQDWERAMPGQGTQPDVIATEQQRNLGYALYKALQAHGGWRINPGGWRVYQNVMQLFGPWTATEGPWKALRIENPTPEERQRLADQRWVFQAHQDHIHVAR